MRRSARILFFLLVLTFITPFFQTKVYSGDLTSTFLRLDRQKVSTSTGGQLCATTPSGDNGTETQVQIIFPSSFTVNSTAANWTATTSDIPTTATAWPGIGTANSVSGQTVTFPSSNLAANTQYCFNFASTSTLTTPSSSGSYEGTVRTRNISNSTIDSIDIGLSIVSSDQISVTATVPANPTDFEATIALIDPANATFDESTTLTYQVTYGSLLNHATSISVEAQWDLGTIQGSGTATEDILDYVVSSATNAYNNSPPVIDTINRKITWTINAFPANTTGETVTFKLGTNDSYKGGQKVDFTVNGRVLGPGTQTSDSTVTSTYLYAYNPTATPTPTCIPGSCPTSTPALTATPTPIIIKPIFSDIDIRTISSSGAAVFVTTNKNTSIKIEYGTNQKALNKSVRENALSTAHLIYLEGLKPKTRYYFRVIASDTAKQSTISDIYLLDTASESSAPKALTDTLIVTSGDVVLTNPLRSTTSAPNIVIPANTPYAFRFGVRGYEDVKSIKVILRDSKVLGINTQTDLRISNSLTITEISPGQYIGKLTSNSQPGSYNIVLQINDFAGNLTEQVLGTMHVVNPLTIVNSLDKKRIEDARVTFYFYNSRLRRFEKIAPNITPIKNPSFSEFDGTVGIVLPEGKYKIEVEALGYESKTAEFEIISGKDSYPIVELKQLPFSATTYLKYSASTAIDVAMLLQKYIHTIRTSVRFFDFIAFIVISLFILLTSISFAKKMSIPFHLFPGFLIFSGIRLLSRNEKTHDVHGRVVNSEGEGIAGVLILISTGGQVLAQTLSNSQGEFFVTIKTTKGVKISAGKKGFGNYTDQISFDRIQNKVEIVMDIRTKPKNLSLSALLWYFGYITGSLFEASLIISFLIELLFVLEFGWWKVLPFILLSSVNLILWAVNARSSRVASV